MSARKVYCSEGCAGTNASLEYWPDCGSGLGDSAEFRIDDDELDDSARRPEL